jgi:hypothetical protein
MGFKENDFADLTEKFIYSGGKKADQPYQRQEAVKFG